MRLMAYAHCYACFHWYSDMKADEVGAHRFTCLSLVQRHEG